MEQRIIKFRAWDKKAKKWLGLWIFRGGHDGQKRHYDKPNVFDITEYFCNPKYENQKHIVMQQSVISDLFEGDIVTDKNNKKWVSSIVWLETGFEFSNEHPGDRSLSELINRGRLKIIGNIYEHPHLLNPAQ